MTLRAYPLSRVTACLIATGLGAVTAALSILVRPDLALWEISVHPGRYVVPSLILILIYAAGTVYLSLQSPTDQSTGIIQLEHDDASRMLGVAGVAAYALLAFAAVFYMGRRFDGIRSFGTILAVLSYGMIPFIMAIVLPRPALWVLNLYLSDVHPIFAMESSPILDLIPIASLIWMFILRIKALKVANGFGTKKSLGTVLAGVAAWYVSIIVYGLVTLMLFEPLA